MKMSGLNSVSVEWANHGVALGENMWKLFAKKTRSTVEHELTFQGKVVDVHFVILDALCENFSSDNIFAFNNADQRNVGFKMSFAINGVNDETLNGFLEFVYRGKTVLSADSLKTFLILVLQARFRDLDKLQVKFFDIKSVTENDDDYLPSPEPDLSGDKRPTDSQQNDSFLSEYVDSFSAFNEEDWSKINLDSFVFTLLKDEAITNKDFDDYVRWSENKTMESVDLDVLDLSQKDKQGCFHVNDILRCCSCLLKEHQHNFTITFSNSESKATEDLRVSNICNVCAVKSSINVTAERVQAKEDADYFLDGYVSRLVQDDVIYLGSYSKETFSSGFSNFCSETKPKMETEGLFICVVCKQSHNSGISLAGHMITVHTNMALLAPKVNPVDEFSGAALEIAQIKSETLTSSATVCRDIKDSGGKEKKYSERDKFRCDNCDYKSCSVFEFKCHRFQHVRISPFACEDCGIKFTFKLALFRHILKKHCESNEFLKCSHCSFKTAWKKSMERHANCCRKSKYRESSISEQRNFGSSQLLLKNAVLKIHKLR